MAETYFGKELKRLQRGLPTRGRRWIYVPYDQMTDSVGPLSRENPNHLGIVLVENPWKASRRPYHKQKLALILANLRHFALEQAGRGVAVRHIVTRGPYRTALESLVKELGPFQAMEPAERELRADLEPLVKAEAVQFIPHEGWLTTRDQFFTSAGETSPLEDGLLLLGYAPGERDPHEGRETGRRQNQLRSGEPAALERSPSEPEAPRFSPRPD